jgi:hypothetical protein
MAKLKAGDFLPLVLAVLAAAPGITCFIWPVCTTITGQPRPGARRLQSGSIPSLVRSGGVYVKSVAGCDGNITVDDVVSFGSGVLATASIDKVVNPPHTLAAQFANNTVVMYLHPSNTTSEDEGLLEIVSQVQPYLTAMDYCPLDSGAVLELEVTISALLPIGCKVESETDKVLRACLPFQMNITTGHLNDMNDNVHLSAFLGNSLVG